MKNRWNSTLKRKVVSAQHARRRSSSRSSDCSAGSVSHSCADRSDTCTQGTSASDQVSVLLSDSHHLPCRFSVPFHLGLQAAAASSWPSPSPETPSRQRTFRSPSSPSVSLTFVPNPSGIGGVLVPTAAKPHRKSSRPSPPKSDPDSPLEEVGGVDSDSNTSSPVSVLPPTPFSPDDHKPLKLSAAPGLQPPCTFIKPEFPQASSSYSPLKLSPALSNPKLSQTDSCTSESFLLSNNAVSGNDNGVAMCFGTQPWSPHAAVQQLQAGSPATHSDSPASGQSFQSQEYMPSRPPQLASLQQLQPQPQFLRQSSPLPGSLSSPLLPGTSIYGCFSTGVPALAMGHPASLLPPPRSQTDQSFRNPMSQDPQQPAATSAADFKFDFDLLCHAMPSAESNLSMTNSAPSISLHDSARTDPTSFPTMGSPLPSNILVSPQTGLEGLLPGGLGGPGQAGLELSNQPARDALQASSLLPSYRQQFLSGSEASLEGQAVSQSPFTFVPAHCTSPSLCYSSAASSLSQSMQSQVLDHHDWMHC